MYQQMLVQLTLQVPAVDSKIARDTQHQGIVGAIDKILPGLLRSYRIHAISLITQRKEEPEQVHTYIPSGSTIACTPQDWRCGECGGQLAPETIGMYKGTRWIHTCGESIRDHESRSM
jgi:hypothetical protein